MVMAKQNTESDKLVERVLKGETLSTVFKTERGAFTVKYPTPFERRQIDLRVADMLGAGHTIAQFDDTALFMMRMNATLDVVVTDAPEWWMKLGAAENYPDTAFTSHLYGRYLDFFRDTGKSISYRADAGGTERTDKDSSVDA
jgi:hypothetical protein